jgi:hypothetical protein
MRVLERERRFEERISQMLLTAWNALQLSININKKLVAPPCPF